MPFYHPWRGCNICKTRTKDFVLPSFPKKALALFHCQFHCGCTRPNVNFDTSVEWCSALHWLWSASSPSALLNDYKIVNDVFYTPHLKKNTIITGKIILLLLYFFFFFWEDTCAPSGMAVKMRSAPWTYVDVCAFSSNQKWQSRVWQGNKGTAANQLGLSDFL